MNESSTENATVKSETKGAIWIRLIYMLLFMVIFGAAEFILYITATIGFALTLFGKPVNARVLKTGHSIGLYIRQIAEYLSFNTEKAPFPFDRWPDETALNSNNTNFD